MAASKFTSHRVHQPEIDFTGSDTASATWAMEDAVINLARRWADETRSSLPKT
jgi:hypothetical protein